MLSPLVSLMVGALFNLIVAFIIVRGIYYSYTQNQSFVFSFLAFNTVIFFVLSLLTSTEVSIGVGFGLFAIFSVLRYRTDEMPIREMTYLFVLIALPVMNAMLVPLGSYYELLFANGMVICVLFALERGWGFRFEGRQIIIYDRIDLVKPENRALLLEDLSQRTGLPVKRVDIGEISFVRDTVNLVVYYDKR
jgi:hypothetical protein